MKLDELQRNFKRPKAKRVGRGMRSGNGKTSGRGNNGRGQRSGPHTKAGFEGGQTPLYRRIPKKKHFMSPNRVDWAIINVGRLNDMFEAGSQVDFAALADKSVIDHRDAGLRVLGSGELKVALHVTASYFSPSAKEKIEAAGGSVQIV
ncbi:MAG: 50S ribosomal protein L15 [Candidatus Sericytochromatia bacterium]